MVPEHSHFRRRLFCLPDGFWNQPGGSFFWREDKDADLLFAQETSLSGQLARQWELRKMAQNEALKGEADSKL